MWIPCGPFQVTVGCSSDIPPLWYSQTAGRLSSRFICDHRILETHKWYSIQLCRQPLSAHITTSGFAFRSSPLAGAKNPRRHENVAFEPAWPVKIIYISLKPQTWQLLPCQSFWCFAPMSKLYSPHARDSLWEERCVSLPQSSDAKAEIVILAVLWNPNLDLKRRKRRIVALSINKIPMMSQTRWTLQYEGRKVGKGRLQIFGHWWHLGCYDVASGAGNRW